MSGLTITIPWSVLWFGSCGLLATFFAAKASRSRGMYDFGGLVWFLLFAATVVVALVGFFAFLLGRSA